jgi:hypothetical protein
MTLNVTELETIAAQWSRARIMHPIYLGIAQRFASPEPPCAPLESPVNDADSGAMATVGRWFCLMDDLIQVHQLRLFLQTSPLANEASLRVLAQHQLGKESRSEADRDKLDFLLVQYFAQSAPEIMMHTPPSFADVSIVLEPVLGKVPDDAPASLAQLTDLAGRLSCCRALRELLEQGLLEKVRELKSAVEDAYFEPAALVAFTRINFLTRQTFFRLMRADLQAIRAGVRDLQQRGVATLDCRRAQLSSGEPLGRVVEMARHWKKPFLAEYSAGNHFVQLAELRTLVEEAVAQSQPRPGSAAFQDEVPVPQAETVSASSGETACAGGAPPAAQAEPAGPAAVPEPAADAGAEPAAAPLPAKLAAEVQNVRTQLSRYLVAERARTRTAGATIVSGNARLALSSWEVTAFVGGMGEFSDIVQQGVALRVLLFQVLEQAKERGSQGRLTEILDAARNEALRLQEIMNTARDAGNIEAAVTLSATVQRLLGTIADADTAFCPGAPTSWEHAAPLRNG